MDEKRPIDWTKWGTLIAFASLGVAALAWRDTRAKDEREAAQEPAKLVAPLAQPIPADGVTPAAEYLPWGQGAPTSIPFRNDGKREALVKQVILSDWKWVQTPRRENIYGAGKTIYAVSDARALETSGESVLARRLRTLVDGHHRFQTNTVASFRDDARD
jgi:hypothetical protein